MKKGFLRCEIIQNFQINLYFKMHSISYIGNKIYNFKIIVRFKNLIIINNYKIYDIFF